MQQPAWPLEHNYAQSHGGGEREGEGAAANEDKALPGHVCLTVTTVPVQFVLSPESMSLCTFLISEHKFPCVCVCMCLCGRGDGSRGRGDGSRGRGDGSCGRGDGSCGRDDGGRSCPASYPLVGKTPLFVLFPCFIGCTPNPTFDSVQNPSRSAASANEMTRSGVLARTIGKTHERGRETVDDGQIGV